MIYRRIITKITKLLNYRQLLLIDLLIKRCHQSHHTR